MIRQYGVINNAGREKPRRQKSYKISNKINLSTVLPKITFKRLKCYNFAFKMHETVAFISTMLLISDASCNIR